MTALQIRAVIPSAGVLSATGLASFLTAWLTPVRIAVWAGFVYTTLAATMPALATYYDRKARGLERRSESGKGLEGMK